MFARDGSETGYSNKDRVMEGLRIVRLPEKHHGDTLWRLEQVGWVG